MRALLLRKRKNVHHKKQEERFRRKKRKERVKERESERHLWNFYLLLTRRKSNKSRSRSMSRRSTRT